MYPQPASCPVCNNPLNVTRLYCAHCDTTIEGHFLPSNNPLANLSPEQIQFVMAFIRCEGRFTRLEDELKLSYPTLRNRLYDILRALGYEPGKEETPAKLKDEDRHQILDELAEGKISFEDAQLLLQGKKPLVEVNSVQEGV
ncbi:MAG: DUF2089 domain-containing protein [Anaerolineaceae bacterium]